MRGIVSRGMGQKTSDWLVIPLCFDHHVGEDGIDNGIRYTVESWEAAHGSQLRFVTWVIGKTGVNTLERARGAG